MTVTPIVTVVQKSASAPDYFLTDLPTTKDELSLNTSDTTNDAFLTRAIAQTSTAIENYCSRVFHVEQLSELIYVEQDPYPYQLPGGVAPLQLSRYPLLSVSSVVQTIAGGTPPTTQSLTVDVDYKIDAARGWLIRLNSFTGVAVPWEALPVTVSYVAGYGSQFALPTNVPATPFQITPADTVDSDGIFSLDLGVIYTASGTALTKVTGTPAVGQYAVNVSTGVYTFAAADAGAAITISGAFTEIPDDLVDAALRLITQRYHTKGRDPTLMEQTQPGEVGTQRFWVGASKGQYGAFPPEIASMLDGIYRVPSLA